MNKKFLSAILFGALMVSSTGTFVSCKDYDDDVTELSAMEAAIPSLMVKMVLLVKRVQPVQNGLSLKMASGYATVRRLPLKL